MEIRLEKIACPRLDDGAEVFVEFVQSSGTKGFFKPNRIMCPKYCEEFKREGHECTTHGDKCIYSKWGRISRNYKVPGQER